jgi:hypothetical protein
MLLLLLTVHNKSFWKLQRQVQQGRARSISAFGWTRFLSSVVSLVANSHNHVGRTTTDLYRTRLRGGRSRGRSSITSHSGLPSLTSVRRSLMIPTTNERIESSYSKRWRNTICSSHADSASASQDCGSVPISGYLHDTDCRRKRLGVKVRYASPVRGNYTACYPRILIWSLRLLTAQQLLNKLRQDK